MAPRPDLKRESLIWRYRPLDRFLEEVRTQATYLRRAELFDDQFEGTLGGGEALVGRLAIREDASDEEFLRWENSHTYVQCWHINDYEDQAMWQRYAPGGVAILTRVQTLRDEYYPRFESTVGRREYIRATFVDYVDLEKTLSVSLGFDPIERFLRKGIEYRSEAEFRVINRVTYLKEIDGISVVDRDRPPEQHGRLIPVDVGRLFERVVVAPDATAAAESEVKKAMQDLGIGERVEWSHLRRPPHR